MSNSAQSASSQPSGLARYRQVLRHRNFALIWTGQTVSWFGDALYFVSLLWLVRELTGSRALMSVVVVCRTVPALFGVFAGVAIDRLDRRRIMIGADLLRAVVVLAVPVLLATDLLRFWHIPVVAFLLASLGVFFKPSQQSLVPVIVKREELAQANSLLTLSQQSVNVVGYATAGLLIYVIGVGSIFFIDAITFVVSAAAIAATRLAPTESNPYLARVAQAEAAGDAGGAKARPGGRWRDDFLTGINFIRGQRAMVIVIPLVMLLNFLTAPYAVLLLPWVTDVLALGAREFGFMQTGITAGMIIGSVVVGLAAARLPRSTLALGALGAFGLASLAFATSRLLPVTVLILVVMGLANAVANVVFVTWAQTITPRPMMGRVFGVLGTLSQAVAPLGQAVSGLVGSIFVLPSIFAAVGGIWVVVSAVYAAVPALRGAFNLMESDLQTAAPGVAAPPAG